MENTIRLALGEFALAMEKALQENEHREAQYAAFGHYTTASVMLAGIARNLNSLETCVRNDDEDLEYEKKCCVDIANYAMMIFDLICKKQEG